MTAMYHPLLPGYDEIQTSIVTLLEATRHASARNVNALMTAAYWEIGRRIVEFEQGGADRATYGDALVQRLAKDLTRRFGRGFSRQNLGQMRAFYRVRPIEEICQTPSGKSPIHAILSALPEKGLIAATSRGRAHLPEDLSALAGIFPLPWSAYICLLSLKDDAARRFYEAEALRCGWSIRQLQRQVNSRFYERTALSKNKRAMLESGEHAGSDDVLTAEEAIKDPFVLEFLDLKDEYSESDLEEALIHHLTDFLLELGGAEAYSVRN